MAGPTGEAVRCPLQASERVGGFELGTAPGGPAAAESPGGAAAVPPLPLPPPPRPGGARSGDASGPPCCAPREALQSPGALRNALGRECPHRPRPGRCRRPAEPGRLPAGPALPVPGLPRRPVGVPVRCGDTPRLRVGLSVRHGEPSAAFWSGCAASQIPPSAASLISCNPRILPLRLCWAVQAFIHSSFAKDGHSWRRSGG